MEQTFGIQVRVSIVIAVRSASNHLTQLFCNVYNHLEGLGRFVSRRYISFKLIFEFSLGFEL